MLILGNHSSVHSWRKYRWQFLIPGTAKNVCLTEFLSSDTDFTLQSGERLPRRLQSLLTSPSLLTVSWVWAFEQSYFLSLSHIFFSDFQVQLIFAKTLCMLDCRIWLGIKKLIKCIIIDKVNVIKWFSLSLWSRRSWVDNREVDTDSLIYELKYLVPWRLWTCLDFTGL